VEPAIDFTSTGMLAVALAATGGAAWSWVAGIS
jgi:hypothetical protein